MKTRKSPIRHLVRSHRRKGKFVQHYVRGDTSVVRQNAGKYKLANPTITKPQLKHFVVRYEVLQDGIWRRDTTNCFVKSKNAIIKDLRSSYIGKPPAIRIISTKLQTLPKPRLKALLDVDTRTQSRMERGYVLDNVSISLINLPPIRSQERLEDNYQKIKTTKAMPPAHLHLLPNGRYEIDDGVHRIHAALKLGYDSVPILIKYGDD
jgi:hypothetical protein